MPEVNELYEAVSKTYAGFENQVCDAEYTVLVAEFDATRIDGDDAEAVADTARTIEKIRELQELFKTDCSSGQLIGAALAVTVCGPQFKAPGTGRRVLHFEVSIEFGGKFCDESFEGRALQIAVADAELPNDQSRCFPLLEFLGDAGTEDSDPSDFYAPEDN
jgi:hypothetical protein